MSGRPALKAGLFLLLPILGGLFVWMAQRDLALRLPQVGVSLDGQKDVVLTVESIDLDREMDGRKWHLTAEKLERSETWARGYSVSIVLLDEKGREWTFSAPQADYDDDLAQVRLNAPSGTLRDGTFEMTWSAGEARWTEEEALWSLSGGIEMEDVRSGARLRSGSGTFDIGGVVILREEARFFWQSP